MHIPDPFVWLSPVARKWLWFFSLGISAVLLLAMNVLDGGIISFEFAGDVARAQQMLSSWGAEAKVHAALSLGMDYLFLVAYSLVISIACVHIANMLKQGWPMMAAAGLFLAWAQFLAALLDAVENYALVQLLLGSQQNLYPSLAWGCALIKFALVGMGLAYLIVGFILSAPFRKYDGI